ncbi:CotH kinase family protein [uncultured Duncaniella sp.]|uniref:CotH kinase family protein n=1 Tax=uncultured Duncaniella sp. TaxID=2768039 RepID=UPI0025E8EC5F|nr:CotH kinase family protein [uncultured Duncaniella sp.]
MKRLLYPTAAILLSVSTTGCSDDVEKEQKGSEQTIVATLDMPVSRTCVDETPYAGNEVGILWMPEDMLGVYGSSTRNALFENTATENLPTSSFNGTMTGNDVPLYAYYPYSETNSGVAPTSLKGSLPAIQHFDHLTGALEGDYKVGIPKAGSSNEFSFSHLFALIRFTIDATGTELAEEELQWISLSAPEGRTLGGDFTFDVTSPGGNPVFTTEGINELKMEWVSNPKLSAGKTFTGYLTCAPAILAGDELKVHVKTDKHIATFTTKAKAALQADYIYTFPLTLKMYAESDKFGWENQVVTDPVMQSFEFTVAANNGKILAKKLESVSGGASVTEKDVTTEVLSINGKDISGMIPYLYDFNLVPTFKVPEGIKVTVEGAEQESGVTSHDFSKPVTYTLEASDGNKAEYTVTVTNTGLPVVVINQSASISGTWTKWFGGVKVRSKDSSWAEDDSMSIYDINGKYTMAAQTCGMRLRGNSTQNFPKKPFAIKLTKKQAIGDMPKHKRWVLLANWIDNSMLRNHTAFAIAHATESASKSGAIGQGMPWNVHGTNVELVIDGRHVGNYYLCEQIKIDANRLNIKDAYEDVLADTGTADFNNCGYLIECDDNYDENCKFVTSKRGIPVMLKDDVSSDILAQIQTKINRIESNIVNGNYSDAYQELDINSIIDQWIVFELTLNDEYKHPKSVYLYMDGGNSKLCGGPVWDFDYLTFPNLSKSKSLQSRYGAGELPRSSSEWLYSNSAPATSFSDRPSDSDRPYMWYPLLFKDAAFRNAVQERWKTIYPYLQQVSAEIELAGQSNIRSWEVNHAIWPLAFNRTSIISWGPGFSGDEDFNTYPEIIDNLKTVYEQRLAWMNQAITEGNFVTTAK